MLKRIFGIITALVLCSCMVVTALADGVNLEDFDVPVTEPPSNIVMSVDFESFDPNQTVQHVVGGIIWAVVSIDNYAEEIGDVEFSKDFEASTYDRVIAALSAEIDLGSDAFSLYADENGDIIWSSPYASLNTLGSVTAGVYGNMMHTLVTPDDNSGFDHPLSAGLLDEADGELFRVALILNDDVAYDEAQLKLVEKDKYSVFTSNLVLLSKEAGQSASDATFKDVKPRASEDAYDYAAGTPGGAETAFTSFKDDVWIYGDLFHSKVDSNGRLEAYSQKYTLENQINQYADRASAPDINVDGYAITNKSYDLSNGFELSFNAMSPDAMNMTLADKKYIYAKVGDYTFSMTGYLLPQVFYKDTYLAGGAESVYANVIDNTSPYASGTYRYKSVFDIENFNRIAYVTCYWDGWGYKTSKAVTTADGTYTFYYQTQSTTAPSSTDLSTSAITEFNNRFASLGLVRELDLSQGSDQNAHKLESIVYTIKLVGDQLIFKKVIKNGKKSTSGWSTTYSDVTAFEYTVTVDPETFDNSKVAIGGEHHYTNYGYYKNPKLVVKGANPSSTDKVYSSVEVGTDANGITYTGVSANDRQTLTKVNTVLGDIVDDGVVRASDYTALKASLTSNGKYSLNAAQMMQADIDLDGKIGLLDASEFWLKLAKTTKKSAYTK